jgi:multimeric flavodoxin WrbA
MGKKVLMIDGSSRKKNTYNILLQIEKILKSHDYEVEIVNLFDYEIKDCVGCETCVTQPMCSLTDDMPKLIQKVLDSDGVILSSPVYMGSVTSRFKTFADRLNIFVHKPKTAGKPVMFVSTTNSTGLKETNKFYGSFVNAIGMRKGEFVSRAGKKMIEPVTEKEISKFLSLLEKDKKYYKPSMSEIVLFNVGKVLALKSTGDDRKFWDENELIDKKFYYPCKMNPCKKMFGNFMFKVLTNAMK